MRLALFALALSLALACDDAPAPPAVRLDAGPDLDGVCTGAGTSIQCVGQTATTCEGGVATDVERCMDVCVPGRGCLLCAPGTVACEGEAPQVCDGSGMARTPQPACDVSAGLRCGPTGCADLCAEAEAANSYIGCEYWPTATLNTALSDAFEMAVVIANPQLVPAAVRIERGGEEVASVSVRPGALETVRLPWVLALKNGAEGAVATSVVRGGAFRLTSDVPVTVTQFNPLDFQRTTNECATGASDDRECYSFTNDASLLLPTHVLTGSYLALSRPSMLLEVTPEAGGGGLTGNPGFTTVVATEDGTEVEVVAAAEVRPALDGSVPALAPGESATVTLDRGDVLQLVAEVPTECPGEWVPDPRAEGVRYCPTGRRYDLTGTAIRASAPVAVIGGHDCTFVPFDRWACDHLEEALFPAESWGEEVFVGPTEPLRGEPNLLRVVSGAEENTIAFDPPIAEPVTLGRGEWVELELAEPARVTGTGPFAAVQFLVGQDYGGFGTSGRRGAGDPSMALGIPVEQLRDEYTFLTPSSYASSFVNVMAPLGARVILDGALVGEPTPVGETGWGLTRVEVDAGVHRMSGSQPFGVLVYGFGSYTSYAVPGGLDLRSIAPPI